MMGTLPTRSSRSHSKAGSRNHSFVAAARRGAICLRSSAARVDGSRPGRVRDDKELAKLAEEERAAWRKFWTQVGTLYKQARAAFSQTDHEGQLSDNEREQSHPLKMTAGKTFSFSFAIRLIWITIYEVLLIHIRRGKWLWDGGNCCLPRHSFFS